MIRKRGSAPIAEKRLANLFVLAVPDWRFIFLRSCLWVRLCAQTQTKDLGNGKCRYFGAQPPIPGCVSQTVRAAAEVELQETDAPVLVERQIGAVFVDLRGRSSSSSSVGGLPGGPSFCGVSPRVAVHGR